MSPKGVSGFEFRNIIEDLKFIGAVNLDVFF